MHQKESWYNWLGQMFKEFIAEKSKETTYKIVDLYECENTGLKKAVIKLSERHIQHKNISEIVADDSLIDGLDSKTVRTLTYIATLEKLTPDFSIVIQKVDGSLDEYILELKSRDGKIIQKNPIELSRDKALIARLSPVDASRVGYLSGVSETAQEYKLLNNTTG